jgi:methyltransferase (TIGR00027 family)
MRATDTAFAIARVRAEEAKRPEAERLFEDPYAELFDDPRADVSHVFELMPFHRAHVRLRTRFIDDSVRGAIEQGVRQLVILGAGFDSRALRLPEVAGAGARVFEVDLAEQLAEKAAILRRGGFELPPHVTGVAGDFSAEDLEATLPLALIEAGLARGRATLFVGEGLVGYLAREPIARMAKLAHALSSGGSRVVLTYHASAWPGATIAELFEGGGWKPGASPSYADLHARWIGPDPLPDAEQYFISVFEH